MDDGTTAFQSTDLCTTCGLCCRGVLFDWVPVKRDEEEDLRRLGLPIEERAEGVRFSQPCSQFCEGLCRIYRDRPLSCRHFRCETLLRLDRGELDMGEAVEIVIRAKRMIDSLQPVIEMEFDALPVGRAWSTAFERWQAASRSGDEERLDAKLVLELAVLNRFLDRYFRPEGWQRVMEQ